jgi:hypothetical protein
MPSPLLPCSAYLPGVGQQADQNWRHARFRHSRRSRYASLSVGTRPSPLAQPRSSHAEAPLAAVSGCHLESADQETRANGTGKMHAARHQLMAFK